ncbi:MAG TPA: histone deacetylase [Bryobacteraceae bacterium]|nr:histone deacetylase [Bryobacteraceae bacterium]
MRKRLYYCDHYTIPLPTGHRFPTAKYRRLRDILATDCAFEFENSPLASQSDIELAHDPEYVRRFLDGSLTPVVLRRIGFPWSEGLVKRTLASVGGTLSATEEAFRTGWGGNLAGGTHHAFRNEGSGYCVFNDLAIAVRVLQAAGKIYRAAIIDLDVHQGDGTAEIFGDDPHVLTISLHCRSNFPFRKQRSQIDVELADGTGDEEYLQALDQVLPRMLAFDPQVIFYQSGVDGLKSDTLGKLALTEAGLRERDHRVAAAALAQQSPLIVTLGGGYSEPMELTAQAHANTYRIVAGTFTPQTMDHELH